MSTAGSVPGLDLTVDVRLDALALLVVVLVAGVGKARRARRRVGNLLVGFVLLRIEPLEPVHSPGRSSPLEAPLLVCRAAGPPGRLTAPSRCQAAVVTGAISPLLSPAS